MEGSRFPASSRSAHHAHATSSSAEARATDRQGASGAPRQVRPLWTSRTFVDPDPLADRLSQADGMSPAGVRGGRSWPAQDSRDPMLAGGWWILPFFFLGIFLWVSVLLLIAA
ncbi:hypothetical protein RISW2_16710 [Roseivivax isoporae LMG 25204]|uniref:Uncharacterized protein n=1 Tax=Roseivivax isoporae LMG 25204 TaxID=1449351 RepID=X7F4T4_9RHOB|nr:hypothetical protein RISW2_16710 [Roseivivax isoporae LMG 25204]